MLVNTLKALMIPACATPKPLADRATIRNRFLPVPDTGFRHDLAEVDEWVRFAPEIITAIETDLCLHAQEPSSGRGDVRATQIVRNGR
jgi:hypothetical protein